MNLIDQDLINELSGAGGVVRTREFYYVTRDGHMLLAFPKDRDFALNTLSLYQPQSWMARVFVHAVKMLIRMRAYFLFKKVVFVQRADSPFSSPIFEGGLGILFGNPKGSARRSIVYHEGGGRKLVSKIGLGNLAKNSVYSELETLKKLSDEIWGGPVLVSSKESKDYVFYTCDFVEGRTPVSSDFPALLKLLVVWQTEDKRRLSEFGLMEEMAAAPLREAEQTFLSQLSDLKLLGSRVHGDFAPWNIKITGDGSIRVLDWEACRIDGFGGMDAAHYLCQMSLLVSKLSADRIINVMLDWGRGEGAIYLSDIGWGDLVDEWVGVYLLFSKYLLNQDREELLKCWETQM